MKSVLLLIAFVLASIHVTEAQQSKKIPRIGFLSPFSSSSDSTRKEAFLQGLRELGYIEGKNIAIEYQSAEGEIDRLPQAVAELVRFNVDVIVTGSINAVRAAKKVTLTIPIVFAAVGDAVDSGLVVSLAKPTGNATGLTFFAPELDAKRMELLKESFPKANLVAFLWLSGSARGDLIKAYEPIAKTLALRLYSFEVKSPADLESGFETSKSVGVDALVVTSNPLSVTHRARIVNLATQHRLPGIYPWTDFAEAGGLLSYGPDIFDNFRRAAAYVDKILKGAKPAELPVEQPSKFELVVNLKTAKQIGVTIPPNVLARADKVIK